MRVTADSFTPVPALKSPHAQTVWGWLTRTRWLVPTRREVLPTPDGDELVLDHLDGPRNAPWVLLLHGLEGSSNSVNIQGLLAHLERRGARATALNFRGCAREKGKVTRFIRNNRPRLYHSGETTDLDYVSKVLARRGPGGRRAAIGVSLGGNVLLKWLGEHPRQRRIAAAATISVPYDLAAGARHLEKGLGPIYTRNFFRTMRKKALELTERFPEARARIDLARARTARTFFEFDDAVTAPLHGFAGATDYYARSSSIGYLSRVTTPTLCLSAQDDPFLPADVLPRVEKAVSPAIHLVVTAGGGHSGFLTGPSVLRPRYWAEETAVDWVLARLGVPAPSGRPRRPAKRVERVERVRVSA